MNENRRHVGGRGLQLVYALAGKVGWTIDSVGPALSTPFAGYLHIPSAQLLLVATVAGLDEAIRQVEPATRTCRSDALVLSVADGETPMFVFAAWSTTGTIWTQPLVLWLNEAGETWIVPPRGKLDGLGFGLVDALHRAAHVPWDDAAAHRAGLDRAAAWLARIA